MFYGHPLEYSPRFYRLKKTLITSSIDALQISARDMNTLDLGRKVSPLLPFPDLWIFVPSLCWATYLDH